VFTHHYKPVLRLVLSVVEGVSKECRRTKEKIREGKTGEGKSGGVMLENIGCRLRSWRGRRWWGCFGECDPEIICAERFREKFNDN